MENVLGNCLKVIYFIQIQMTHEKGFYITFKKTHSYMKQDNSYIFV